MFYISYIYVHFVYGWFAQVASVLKGDGGITRKYRNPEAP